MAHFRLSHRLAFYARCEHLGEVLRRGHPEQSARAPSACALTPDPGDREAPPLSRNPAFTDPREGVIESGNVTCSASPPSARMTEPGNPPTSSEIVFYQGEDGRSRIQVRLDGGTVWLTQRLLGELFQKDVRTINEHIHNIFDEGELDPGATIRKFRIVQTEGKREVARLVDHYNLDVILAVGYRVRSHRGTQFRRWATERLREYVVKGFVLDDERLKEGRTLGADHFDELLERIRDIRASEKRFYQKIRDLYALSIDYDPATAETKEFFQVVQNKLHWAITGSTAAEIIAERADAEKPNMGLTFASMAMA